MNPLLFVYGTLMSHTGTQKALRLGHEAELVGAATIPGQLFRITWYPGLVEGEGRVHGEVFRLQDPAQSLVWLDAYEGIVPDDGTQNRNDYERVERVVQLATGEECTAWVYLYLPDLGASERVTDGRWT